MGRALGMWGFGCYGTGIASAEEVLRVADRPDPGGTPPDGVSGAANGGSGAAPASAGPPSDGAPEPAAETELARLGQALGLRPGEVALRRAQAASDAEAVARASAGQLATQLIERRDDPGARSSSTRRAWASAPRPIARTSRPGTRSSDGDEPELGLTEAQFREERERFVRRYQEPGVAAGFRDAVRAAGGARRLTRRPGNESPGAPFRHEESHADMSHVATIALEFRDPRRWPKRPPPAASRWRRTPSPSTTGRASPGRAMRLPGWRYPVVIDATGRLFYDHYEGRWGDLAHLHRFRQAYAEAATTRFARARRLPGHAHAPRPTARSAWR